RVPAGPTLFPYTTLFRSGGRRGDLHDAARVTAGERIETGTRICAQTDPLHAARAHEVREVASGSAVVEEMPACCGQPDLDGVPRSEEHTSELQSLAYLVC